jgi:hypothetical protein
MNLTIIELLKHSWGTKGALFKINTFSAHKHLIFYYDKLHFCLDIISLSQLTQAQIKSQNFFSKIYSTSSCSIGL